MDILSQRKFLLRLVIVLAVLNLALVGFFGWKYAFRSHKNREKKANSSELAAVLTKEMGLSGAQADSLEKIRTVFFEKEKILSEATRSKRDSMNQLMFAAGNNDSALRALAAGVAENEYKMELLRIEQAARLRTICNPEQLKKLESLIREIRDYLKPDEKKEQKEK